MSVAWVGVGVAAVGAISSASSSRKATNAQKDIAAQASIDQNNALREQVRQADELLDFNMEQYDDNKIRQSSIDAVTNRVVENNLALSQEAGDRSRDSYDFYKTNGRPVVQKALEEAQNFDSQSNIDKARGRATADVQQGFENADAQSQTALSRMGINPSSGRFLALQQSMQAQKAAALAGAATGAEDQTRNQAINMRQQASNLAQGFPAQTTADGGLSGGTANSAAANARAGLDSNIAIGQQFMNGAAAGAGIYGSAASGYNSAVNGANYQLSNIQRQASNDMAGWGSLAGMGMQRAMSPSGGGSNYGNISTYSPGYENAQMANGGPVNGPGTGTSDSVPAKNVDTGQPIRLSNGEYVISADTVRAKGTKFFDDLQAKHHKHVNLGRTA